MSVLVLIPTSQILKHTVFSKDEIFSSQLAFFLYLYDGNSIDVWQLFQLKQNYSPPE